MFGKKKIECNQVLLVEEVILKKKEQRRILCTITKLFQEKCHYIKRWGNGTLFLSKLVSRFLLLNLCVLVKFLRINRRHFLPFPLVIWRVSAWTEEPSLLASSPKFLCHLRPCSPSAQVTFPFLCVSCVLNAYVCVSSFHVSCASYVSFSFHLSVLFLLVSLVPRQSFP